MEIVSKRLKALRENVGISQNKLGKLVGLPQSSINRYEQGQSSPSAKTFRWYADYFDVSMDYIYGRTDNPNGMLYQRNADEMKAALSSERDMEIFAKMCFAPGTIINDKLKETIVSILKQEIRG